jgi:Potential Queuosine, Q, salvage protein family
VSGEPERGPLFARVREAAAEVTRRARHVRIEDEALEELAGLLSRERPAQPSLDPAHQAFPDEASTVAFVVTINAINFGSGWFPHLAKRDGLSGYLTIAAALRERVEREGAWSAAELERLRPEDCARVFGQTLAPPVSELMALFAQALNELGVFLAREHRGRYAGPIEEARGSAERLVQSLARMPLYRDVARYEGFEVPFYKRAQITCSDLAEALRGRGLGRFDDIDELTLFADNLVPHVLRTLGVLLYSPDLSKRIDSEELIPWGSEEEVEIRAVALHAVERLAGSCARRGWKAPPRRLDHLLWSRGQSPRVKARPRHRTRCAYY